MTKLKADGSLLEWAKDYCFEHGDNYLVECAPAKTPTNRKLCAIYFAGGGIYEPKTIDGFCKDIIGRNRYEFYGTRIAEAEKHIYLRDFTISWYLKGVNSKIDSIDKVEELLRKETAGYEIVCVGASMGGYAAMYFARHLKAKKCFAFSPFLDPSLIHPHVTTAEDLSKTYVGHTDTDVYMYFAGECEADLVQAKLAEKVNNPQLRLLYGKTKQHGISFSREVVERILNASDEKLKEMFDGSWVKSPVEKLGKMGKPSSKKKDGFATKLSAAVVKIEYKLFKHLKKRLEREGVSV